VSKKTIAIVEDDDDIRADLSEILGDEGYEVRGYRNGKEALDALRGGALPDLILLDLMMPVMNGYLFHEEQSADERLRAIPVVMMSADGQAEKNLLARPPTAFLKKPFDLEALFATVRRCAL
jgi:two-component system chemotaxis response regulator CheY